MTVVAAERTAALLESLSEVDVPQHQEDSALYLHWPQHTSSDNPLKILVFP